MKMRSLYASLLSAIMLSGVINLVAGCMPVQELEECVSREPASSGDGAGYELIDLLKKEVWGTADFTPDEYDAFTPPFLWMKNDPRIMLADGAEFLQSPGCSEPGQFTYMRAYDKEFLNVVQLITMGTPVDPEGLIRSTELEKYHVLTYFSGRTVSILQGPTGARFIWVARTVDRPPDPVPLPEGWTLSTHELQTDLQVDLLGNVSVLRIENEDSYQGPLPDGFSF
jgi:hypothetical protein